MPFHYSRTARERRQPGEACSLFRLEGAELRHFDQQHARGHGTDAGDGGQDAETLGQVGIVGNPGCDGLVDLGKLLLDDGQPRLRAGGGSGRFVAVSARFPVAVRSLISASRATCNSLNSFMSSPRTGRGGRSSARPIRASSIGIHPVPSWPGFRWPPRSAAPVAD